MGFFLCVMVLVFFLVVFFFFRLFGVLLFCFVFFFNLEYSTFSQSSDSVKVFLFRDCSFIKCSALFKDAPMLICSRLKASQNGFPAVHR